ncbi:MAG TPA: hypothetical protein VMY40_05220, partial [Anaerolineae bacterium]|nr:hypothetical protein [Anaerolineae bacterium]
MPNLMFKTPKITVELAESRQREYHIGAGSEGLWVYDDLASLAQAGKLTPSVFPANTLLQFGSQEVSQIIAIDRQHLKGILPRPIYRQPLPAIRGDGTPTRRWGVETSTGAPDWPTAAGTVHNDFLDYYAFTPTDTDNWDFTLRQDGLLYDMTQKVAYENDGTNIDDWVRSEVGFNGPEIAEVGGTWGQAPNPFFTVGFRRQALSELFIGALEDARAADAATPLCGTTIGWGGMHVIIEGSGESAEGYYTCPYGKWMLYCPLVGKPVLYEWVGSDWPWGPDDTSHFVPRPWTEGDLSDIKAEDAAEKGYTYHIGTMGHAICVSEGGFDGQGQFAYYLVDDRDEPVVPSGAILVSNFPGQFTCWLDLNVFPVASCKTWPKYAPSLYTGSVQSRVLGEPFSWAVRDSTVAEPEIHDELPDVVGLAAEVIGPYGMEALYGSAWRGHMQYELRMSPGIYPDLGDPDTDVITQTAPFVEAVQVWQNPALSTFGPPTFAATDRVPVDLSIDGELEGNQHLELAVSNLQPGYTPPVGEEPAGGWSPTRDWTIGRAVKVTHAGWIYQDLDGGEDEDAGAVMGKWWIAQPRLTLREAQFDVIDLLGWLNLAKWEGEDP